MQQHTRFDCQCRTFRKPTILVRIRRGFPVHLQTIFIPVDLRYDKINDLLSTFATLTSVALIEGFRDQGYTAKNV